VYAVAPSKDFPAYLLVRCPKEDCPSHIEDEVLPFLVDAEVWRAKREAPAPPDLKARGQETVEIFGRSCPYCMRVSRMPAAGRKRSA
jgi:hypothetical protein